MNMQNWLKITLGALILSGAAIDAASAAVKCVARTANGDGNGWAIANYESTAASNAVFNCRRYNPNRGCHAVDCHLVGNNQNFSQGNPLRRHRDPGFQLNLSFGN